MGGDTEQDELVYHEEDEQFYVHLGKSRDEKILSIHVGNALPPFGSPPGHAGNQCVILVFIKQRRVGPQNEILAACTLHMPSAYTLLQ